MTIIEFFDSTPIHNAAGMLLLAPDEVVLVGEKSVPMHAFRSRLEKIIKAHGLTTKIHVESVDTRNFPKLIEKLESILLSYRDCAFDLTGGQTEILVAMGALSQKYGLPMHTVDPVRGTVSPFTCKETYPAARTASLSISENIALYDGKVTEALTPPDEEAFWQDVLAVWSVASRDPAAWNSAISTLHAFCAPEEMFAEIRMWEVSKKFPAHRVDTLRKIIMALQ